MENELAFHFLENQRRQITFISVGPCSLTGSDAINGSEVIHQAALLLNFFLIHRTVRALKLFHFLSDMDITKFQKKILLFFAVYDFLIF